MSSLAHGRFKEEEEEGFICCKSCIQFSFPLQVVAGIKYVITVKMAKTPCRNDGVEEVCAIETDQAKAKVLMASSQKKQDI